MNPAENLLMLSGDTVLATGRQGVFHGVLEGLSRSFARIDVITPRPGGAVTTTELFGNVHLHPAPGARLLQTRHAVATARALFAARRYALMTSHDYGIFSNGRAAWRLHRASGVPWVAEIHHVPGHPRPASLRERLDLPLTRLYARFAARHAVAIRVVNHVEMPALLRSFGVPEEKIRVIPSLYLDLERFRPQPVAKDVDVLMVGRLVANKRFDLVLDALARLKAAGRSVRARLIGEGPLEGRLLARARRLGVADALRHDRFLPTAGDLARAYAQARVLVCASTSEGGPRVTCEAMACGTPVVSTAVGLMTELIHGAEGPANGFLVDWDAAVIAERIGALLDDPAAAAAIGARGREAVLPFERNAMIRNYADQLKALARAAAAAGGVRAERAGAAP